MQRIRARSRRERQIILPRSFPVFEELRDGERVMIRVAA